MYKLVYNIVFLDIFVIFLHTFTSTYTVLCTILKYIYRTLIALYTGTLSYYSDHSDTPPFGSGHKG